MLATACTLIFTWRRLFVGMDLQDESYYVLVPWRWALGDRPFVHEQNLAQVGGFLEYPFIKLFGVLRGYDVTGLVLYARHLYLLLMIAVAAVVVVAVCRLLRWELALVAGTVFVSFIYWQTPQLSYNTIAAAFLTLGTALGLWVVFFEGGRGWAFASGAAFGLGVVAYPTLVFIMPFFAVFLALAMGQRSVAVLAERSFSAPPDPDRPPTGRPAWRAISFWVLGGVAVLLPFGLFVLSFGVHSLERSWSYSMTVASHVRQLGGAPKAVEVTSGFWRFLWSRPYLLVAALLAYLIFLRWPRIGRLLLALLPVALWLAGQRSQLNAAGFVIVYALLAPYLFLFVPRSLRHVGAKLLYWVWAPSVIAGAMTAFTSAAGYVSAPVGLLPALIASGVFLAWSLEGWRSPAGDGASAEAGTGTSWLALLVLVAILGVTVAFQFQFQERAVPYSDLTKRFDFGPWWGIRVTPERYAELRLYSTDLQAQGRPGDQLLEFSQAPGYYLFWNGGIAANSYWLSVEDAAGRLPQSTVDYYRRNRIVPTLVVHLIQTAGMTDAELAAACGGLAYPPTLVRPGYAFQRKPADETTEEVLARLPRQ